MIITIIIFFLVLSLLVLVHELGHFLAAKKTGIKVEEFGFGLPPRIVGLKKGETIYSLNWLPIGGFVKLYGEDEADLTSGASSAFYQKPKKVRAAVLLAGVAMNFLLAVLISYLILGIANFKTEIPLFFNYQFFAVNQSVKEEVIIGKVSPGSPAAKAGVRNDSKVLLINQKSVKSGEEFLKIVNENKGKTIDLELLEMRTFENYKVRAVPRLSPPKNEGPLGIAFSSVPTAVLKFETPVQKIFSGVTYSLNLLFYNLTTLGKLVAVSFQEKTAAPVGEAVSGPVGIYLVVLQIVRIPNLRERIIQGLSLVSLISISLAFFNLLPFPALDGGRLLFVVIEAVTGRRVKAHLERWVHQAGMMVLLGLIVLVTINDVLRIFRK